MTKIAHLLILAILLASVTYRSGIADEPEKLVVGTDAIFLFTFESASTILFWDTAKGQFRSVAESD